nr:hypothetical protein [Bradyrhizobium altum]
MRADEIFKIAAEKAGRAGDHARPFRFGKTVNVTGSAPVGDEGEYTNVVVGGFGT